MHGIFNPPILVNILSSTLLENYRVKFKSSSSNVSKSRYNSWTIYGDQWSKLGSILVMLIIVMNSLDDQLNHGIGLNIEGSKCLSPSHRPDHHRASYSDQFHDDDRREENCTIATNIISHSTIPKQKHSHYVWINRNVQRPKEDIVPKFRLY